MTVGTLLVIVGPDNGRRFTLPTAEPGDETPISVGIGRGTANPIRLRDTEVSRRHAQLRCGDHRYRLADVGSSNGTLLNGEKLRETATLRDGDRVQVGRTTLLFSLPDSDESRSGVSLVGSLRDDPSGATLSALPTGRGARPKASAGSAATTLQVLYRVAEEAVRPTLNTEQLLGRLLDLALEAVGAERGCILLVDADGTLQPAARRDRDRARSDAVGGPEDASSGSAPMPVSRSIAGHVLHTGEALRTGDAAQDSRFDPTQSIMAAGVKEALCVPLRGRDDVEGVMYLDTTTDAGSSILSPLPERFTDDHLHMLLAIGRQAALAVEAVRYQTALVRAERLAAVGQTISALSHHIKNILQGLGGGGHLVKTGLDRHDEALARQGWEIVERNQNRILHLVTDMLTFGKDRRPELERGDVAATVADAVGLARARAAEVGVEVELDAAAVPP
ncbi:MAG: FHA domain-containing protein, partial [Planctomycetota bacterium]